jgi:hypothetical protein
MKPTLLFILALTVLSSDAGAGTITGVVKVTSNPSGAIVFVHGKTYGPTPALIELGAGEHALFFSLAGYAPVTKSVSVEENGFAHVGVRFRKGLRKDQGLRVHQMGPGQADSGPGAVNISTQPKGLLVFMNDLLVPQPTPVSFDIMAGIYDLTLEKDGEIVYQKTVFIRAGRTTELDIIVKKKRRIDDSDPWN